MGANCGRKRISGGLAVRGFTYLEDQTWIDREITRGNDDLPITLAQAARATKWLKRNFGDKIEAVTKDTPFPPHIVCAICCQETAIYWIGKTDKLPAEEILGCSVYDASGDYEGTSRSAFPRNTNAFREKYGDVFADMLIEEANKTRKVMKGWEPKEWVYKGYGIFQYDLQAIVDDEAFFQEKQWYNIDACLDRCMQELKHKWARTNDLWASVKAYNGSGARADQYRRNVQRFAAVTEEVWITAPGPDPVVVPAPGPVVVAVAPPSQPAPSSPATTPAQPLAAVTATVPPVGVPPSPVAPTPVAPVAVPVAVTPAPPSPPPVVAQPQAPVPAGPPAVVAAAAPVNGAAVPSPSIAPSAPVSVPVSPPTPAAVPQTKPETV
jgi:hypothetical protein